MYGAPSISTSRDRRLPQNAQGEVVYRDLRAGRIVVRLQDDIGYAVYDPCSGVDAQVGDRLEGDLCGSGRLAVRRGQQSCEVFARSGVCDERTALQMAGAKVREPKAS